MLPTLTHIAQAKLMNILTRPHWTQATSPRNWQYITNDIHEGQHKPNFPSNSWLNTILIMTATQG